MTETPAPVSDIYASVREIVLTGMRTIAPGLPDDVAARIEISPSTSSALGNDVGRSLAKNGVRE